MLASVAVLLSLQIQGALSCVVPPEPTDFWGTADEGVDGAPAPRLRREVTLRERKACQGGDPQPTVRVDTRERVNALVVELQNRNLDAYIVPTDDEHQSEYVARADERRAFLTGFFGSAGTAVVLADGRRALWTDGRYFLAADDEMDCDWLLMRSKEEGVPTMTEWLGEQLSAGAQVGIDPALVGADQFVKTQKKLEENLISLVPESTNLVDLVWPDSERPPRDEDPVYVLDTEFAGLKWSKKVADVRDAMRTEKVDLMVITALDEVAWLLNLRGHDIPYNPVFRSYVMIDFTKVILFIDSERITPIVDFHLHASQCIDDICFQVTGYDNLVPRLQSESKNSDVQKVLLPKKYGYSGGASYAVVNAVPEEKRHSAVSPVLLMKARKNDVEFKGMKRAHVRDAVALIDFLAFMEKQIDAGNDWDELTAASRLEQFRVEQEHFVSLSFETISAFGPSGSIIHYRPSNTTARKISRDSLYLLDSGAQYKDGTTDVTRTLHYGEPTALQKETYTRVLMGALDLASLVFPKGTGDSSVDVLARRHLYQVGLDYKHGTGHGIGMFLNIHESPTQVRIHSKENHEFELGQFFSDEPGYYKDGEFGIRLETILAVVEARTLYTPDKPFYAFEAITLVPFEPKLIDMTLLSGQQCAALNYYHSRVRSIVGEELENQGKTEGLQYMLQRTVPLTCSASNGLPSGAHAAMATSATIGPRGAPPVQSGAATRHPGNGVFLSSLIFVSVLLGHVLGGSSSIRLHL